MSFHVTGLRELIRASTKAERDTKLFVRAALREVGEVVRTPAKERLMKLSPVSAAGLRVRVRQRGVAVEQSKRRVDGKHPDWGITQMHLLLGVREEEKREIERKFEDAIGKIADHFERG